MSSKRKISEPILDRCGWAGMWPLCPGQRILSLMHRYTYSSVWSTLSAPSLPLVICSISRMVLLTNGANVQVVAELI